MTCTEEKVARALTEQFQVMGKPALPSLWSIQFPVCLRSVGLMETPAIREWFRGFTPVTKLGMWWYLNHTNLGYFVCLHGSKRTPPLIDSFDELILWISNEAEALVVGGQGRITNKNLTFLDYSTLPATTPQ